MYKINERVPKTENNKYGSQPVTENPFEQPCLLCISAFYDATNNLADKSNFGMSKIGMEMAGLRTRGQNSAGFDLSGFPVKFLSIKADHSDEKGDTTEEDRTDDFVDRYLLPLVSENGKKIDTAQAMKKVRNVNMMSFCDGVVFVQNVEHTLISRMEELGYSGKECANVLSQMCVFSFATNRLKGEELSTCISFKDINDTEVNDDVTKEEKKTVLESPTKGTLFQYSDNKMAYLFSGKGDHILTKYIREGKIAPALITSIIGKVLQNSIENAKSRDFKPISIDGITSDITQLEEQAKKGKSLEEIMGIAYSNLQYADYGANKLSKEEMDLLDKKDIEYDEKIQEELKAKKVITINTLVKNALQQKQLRSSKIAEAERNSDKMVEAGFSRGGDL